MTNKNKRLLSGGGGGIKINEDAPDIPDPPSESPK